MRLEHSFTVPVGIDAAWKILLDIERIGPCLPGAAIASVDGDHMTGTVKVKLGPIGLTYKGRASFVEKDEAAHRAVVDARGRDARGNGTASATVTAVLSERDGETHVQVVTDLDITGKPAQFGRGVLVDVGNRIIDQFAESLAETIGSELTPASGPISGPISGPMSADASSAVAPPAVAPPAVAPPAVAPPAIAPPAVAPPAVAPPAIAPPAIAPPEAAAAASVPPAIDMQAAAPATDRASTPVAAAPRQSGPPHEIRPLDLVGSAASAVATRLAPIAVAVVALLLGARAKRKR